jgi:peptidoglycan/LPS O-acetylase OafA/YrhL
MGRSETLKFDKMNYRAEIDGFRALAVIRVVIFYAGFDFF